MAGGFRELYHYKAGGFGGNVHRFELAAGGDPHGFAGRLTHVGVAFGFEIYIAYRDQQLGG